MMRKVLLLAAAATVSAAASTAAQSPSAAVTTVVIVRHAEAVPGGAADPVLSEAGIARANALAAALKDAGVATVFASQYQRTKLTGQPVATAMNVPLVATAIAAGAAGLDSYVKQIVADVHTKHAGRTVVIVGHSNTVRAIRRPACRKAASPKRSCAWCRRSSTFSTSGRRGRARSPLAPPRFRIPVRRRT